ncbi:MAG: hypothetical protein C0592_10390 [Marinilabiliales bacterium]|nr:MAG: hypothetical protein C0592_10390 [Marinilabiliales bacterium]
MFFIKYYIFIKKIYSKRWKGFESSAKALAFTGIFIPVLFLLFLIDYLFKLNLLMSIHSSGLPLAPIAFFASPIIFIPMFLLLKRIRPSFSEKRELINKTAKTGKTGSWIYIITLCIEFAGILILAIIQA